MIKSGMIPKQRDVLLIPIPFTDLTSVKRRPVLVLSNDSYNNSQEDIIIAAITSNIRDIRYGIKFDNEDLQEGFLQRTSQIRIDKIYTLNKKIILRRFGKLKQDRYKDVVNSLLRLIE